MKRIFIVVACLVFAVTIAAPVKAATLGFDELIGWLEPGTPADYHEIYYVHHLISMYNIDDPSDTNVPVAPPPVGKFNNFYLYVPNASTDAFGSALTPPPLEGVVVKDETSPFFPIDLSSTAYEFGLVKFGGLSALFYLGGIDSIVGISLAGNFGLDSDDVSHVTLFNPTTVPVPEPGTMILLGSGLIGLAGWGRKKFRK